MDGSGNKMAQNQQFHTVGPRGTVLALSIWRQDGKLKEINSSLTTVIKRDRRTG
jgi:hypothetical protein